VAENIFGWKAQRKWDIAKGSHNSRGLQITDRNGGKHCRYMIYSEDVLLIVCLD